MTDSATLLVMNQFICEGHPGPHDCQWCGGAAEITLTNGAKICRRCYKILRGENTTTGGHDNDDKRQ